MEVKPRVTCRGWKSETRLGRCVIWAVTTVDTWSFLLQEYLVTVEHTPVSCPRPGERAGGFIHRFPPVTGRGLPPGALISGTPNLSCHAQSGLRGPRTPSDAKDIRPVCLEVGRAAST